jgi:hypothetical protein
MRSLLLAAEAQSICSVPESMPCSRSTSGTSLRGVLAAFSFSSMTVNLASASSLSDLKRASLNIDD